jgi:lipoprotein
MAIGGQKSSRATTPNAQGGAIACLIHAITAALNRRTRMACNLRLAAQPDPPLLAARQQQLAQTDRFLAG